MSFKFSYIFFLIIEPSVDKVTLFQKILSLQLLMGMLLAETFSNVLATLENNHFTLLLWMLKNSVWEKMFYSIFTF